MGTKAKRKQDLGELLTDVSGLLREVSADVKSVLDDAGKSLRESGSAAVGALKRAQDGLWQVCPVCNGKALSSKRRCVTCDGTRIISVLTGRPPARK